VNRSDLDAEKHLIKTTYTDQNHIHPREEMAFALSKRWLLPYPILRFAPLNRGGEDAMRSASPNAFTSEPR
jgi:hypothetical protein